MRYRTLLATLLTLLLVTGAQARDWSMYQLGEAQTVKVGGFLLFPAGGDLETDSLAGGGVQFHYLFTRMLALETSVHRLTDTADIATATEGHSTEGSIERKTWAIQVSGRVTLPLHNRLGAYGLAGIGYYAPTLTDDVNITTSTDFTDRGAGSSVKSSADDAFGVHFGVGLQWVALDNMEIFGEYRWQVVDSSIDYQSEVRSAEGDVVASTSESISGYDSGMFRLGFNFYF